MEPLKCALKSSWRPGRTPPATSCCIHARNWKMCRSRRRGSQLNDCALCNAQVLVNNELVGLRSFLCGGPLRDGRSGRVQLCINVRHQLVVGLLDLLREEAADRGLHRRDARGAAVGHKHAIPVRAACRIRLFARDGDLDLAKVTSRRSMARHPRPCAKDPRQACEGNCPRCRPQLSSMRVCAVWCATSKAGTLWPSSMPTRSGHTGARLKHTYKRISQNRRPCQL